jgi:hypothetical protein
VNDSSSKSQSRYNNNRLITKGIWFEELKFNKHGSIFILFDKKFSILDQLGLIDSSPKLLLICVDIHIISLRLVLHVFEKTLI